MEALASSSFDERVHQVLFRGSFIPISLVFLVYFRKFHSFLIFLVVLENSSHDRIIAANPRINLVSERGWLVFSSSSTRFDLSCSYFIFLIHLFIGKLSCDCSNVFLLCLRSELSCLWLCWFARVITGGKLPRPHQRSDFWPPPTSSATLEPPPTTHPSSHVLTFSHNSRRVQGVPKSPNFPNQIHNPNNFSSR